MSKTPPQSLSHHEYASRIAALSIHLDDILSVSPLAFATMTPTKLPEQAGVYIIYTTALGPTSPYYIGRTKNLRQRLYNNHLMGPLNNARLKKYLIEAKECLDIPSSKAFIRTQCHARWIIIPELRERFLAEGFLAAVLRPKYGLYEEH